MWYKKDENQWFQANKVEFPNGDVLDNNHEETIDGWFWSETEPTEFLEWKTELEKYKV